MWYNSVNVAQLMNKYEKAPSAVKEKDVNHMFAATWSVAKSVLRCMIIIP